MGEDLEGVGESDLLFLVVCRLWMVLGLDRNTSTLLRFRTIDCGHVSHVEQMGSANSVFVHNFLETNLFAFRSLTARGLSMVCHSQCSRSLAVLAIRLPDSAVANSREQAGLVRKASLLFSPSRFIHYPGYLCNGARLRSLYSCKCVRQGHGSKAPIIRENGCVNNPEEAKVSGDMEINCEKELADCRAGHESGTIWGGKVWGFIHMSHSEDLALSCEVLEAVRKPFFARLLIISILLCVAASLGCFACE